MYPNIYQLEQLSRQIRDTQIQQAAHQRLLAQLRTALRLPRPAPVALHPADAVC
jgi:hypothetical protein